MELDLDELERLSKAATPGPWKRGPYVSDGIFSAEGMILFDDCTRRRNFNNNISYIVASCNATLDLIARVRELERQNAGLEARIRYLTEERNALEWELNNIKRGD